MMKIYSIFQLSLLIAIVDPFLSFCLELLDAILEASKPTQFRKGEYWGRNRTSLSKAAPAWREAGALSIKRMVSSPRKADHLSYQVRRLDSLHPTCKVGNFAVVIANVMVEFLPRLPHTTRTALSPRTARPRLRLVWILYPVSSINKRFILIPSCTSHWA